MIVIKKLLKPFLFMMILAALVSINCRAQSGNADWMRHVKFGVMVHYMSFLQNGTGPQNMGKITNWDSCVNDFDVNRFASQLNQIGAGYVIFTMYQRSRFVCAPNSYFEKITGYARGQATSHRDLIMDLSKALKKYNIKLIVYVTGDGMFQDDHTSHVLQSPMLKWKENGDRFKVTDTWVNNWSAVLKEWGTRYAKIADGWFVDGAYDGWGYNDTSLSKLYTALKGKNLKSIIAFNNAVHPRIQYYTKWDTFTYGEMNTFGDLPPAGGKINGKQWHILSFLGTDWFSDSVKYTAGYMIDYLNKVNALGGVATINVVALRNGSIPAGQLAFLKQVSQNIKPR